MACSSCTSLPSLSLLLLLTPNTTLNHDDPSVQVILSRKEDILALDREGEEAMGMVHAVLSALPPLSEDDFSQ